MAPPLKTKTQMFCQYASSDINREWKHPVRNKTIRIRKTTVRTAPTSVWHDTPELSPSVGGVVGNLSCTQKQHYPRPDSFNFSLSDWMHSHPICLYHWPAWWVILCLGLVGVCLSVYVSDRERERKRERERERERKREEERGREKERKREIPKVGRRDGDGEEQIEIKLLMSRQRGPAHADHYTVCSYE